MRTMSASKAIGKLLYGLLIVGVVIAVVAVGLYSGFLAQNGQQPPLQTRESAIPSDAVKMTPATDVHPPVLHSSGWDAPVPLSSVINTAGAEDSPFILPDGNTLYFFFTPDVSVPAEKQVLDGVTGI